MEVVALSRFVKAESLKAQLLRGGAGSLALKVANAGIGMALAIVLARTLGPSGYGTYAFAFSIVMVLAIPAQLGLPTLLVREVARYQLRGEWGLLRGLLRWANLAVILISGIIILVAAGIGWVLWADHEAKPQLLPTLFWALALVPLISLGNLRAASLRGLRLIVKSQLSEMVLRPGVLLILVLLVWHNWGMTSIVAMALHVVSSGVAFFIGAVLLFLALRRSVPSTRPVYETKRWLSSVLPLSFLAGVDVLTRQTDIVMLGALASQADVGIYRVSVQGATLVTLSLAVVNMVVAPHFARIYEAGDSEKLQRLVTASARITFIAALPVTIVLIVFGRPILEVLFGLDYGAGHLALAVLGVGQLISAGAGSVGYLLNMTGNEGETARMATIAAASNILLNVVLIPPFGMVGAAIATSVTITVLNGMLCWRVWLRLGIRSSAFIRS